MTSYTEITTIEQWKDLFAQSQTTPILVLKHSTTCPISAAAYRQFESFDSPVAKYVIKVIEHRDVSNEIAANVAVRHASPQALLIHAGVARWNDSHFNITKDALQKAVQL